MALDRQRILGELGSVMKQLQSADCGCLGKLFGGPQQTMQPGMGSPLPTCGGCRRACCCGHGYRHYNPPMSQTAQNMSPTQFDYASNSQQPMSGNAYGMGPQIVNMMRGDNHRPANIPVQEQSPLTGPMVIDAPQSPHGKVGVTPFNPTATYHQEQPISPSMNQANVTGQVQRQYTQLNSPANMIPWTQQNMAANNQMASPESNPHGQHSQGIAKFNQMYPGVKQGLGGGDLGFDPMAIAIQMNPDNHLQCAMDTMHKIMNDNKVTDKILNNPAAVQPGMTGNANQIANQQMYNTQNIPDQVFPTQQEKTNMQETAKYQQNQQVYSANVESSSINQQNLQHSDNQQLPDQQQLQKYGRQQLMDYVAPNLPVAYDETAENNQIQPLPNQQNNHDNQQPAQQMIKEPIFPADSSRNVYMPSRRHKNYGYNTLGQPIEMLPAKIYHPPEPSLPQTLSPQNNPVKPRYSTPKSLKATVSKTSIAGNKPDRRTPSKSQLQHVYNQYKGSQSYTQRNVRHPGEGTHSDGRLNVPANNVIKAAPVPVERVGGDTIVNNPPNNEVLMTKVEQVLGQIGDMAPTKPTGNAPPVKENPAQMKKCRNGLQDVIFSSYPTSTAWTFHGRHADHSIPPPRYRSRQH